MGRLDQNLKRSCRWYKDWHGDRFSSFVHWFVLAVFSFSLVSGIFLFYQPKGLDYRQEYVIASYQQEGVAKPSHGINFESNQPLASSFSSKSYGDDNVGKVFADDWYDSGWQYRKKITIDHTKVDDDLTDFPVLVSLDTDADLAAHAQDDFDDILFTDSNQIKLPHEIEDYDNTTGELRAWVKADLADLTDTELYIYYGNNSCGNQENVNDVWSNGYAMVQHLEESPPNDTGVHYDSTSNGNNGTPKNFNGVVGSRTDGIGKINGADEFNTDDYIDIGNRVTSAVDNFTVSLWLYPDTDSHSYLHKIAFYNGDDDGGWGFGLGDVNDTKVMALYGGVAWIDSGYSIPSDAWYQIVLVRDSGTTKFYVNGSQTPNTSLQAPNVPNDHCLIANEFGQDRYIDDRIDEVRVSTTSRSGQWISTQFSNQGDPGSFYVLSDETEQEFGDEPDNYPLQDDLLQGGLPKLLPQTGSPSF